MRRLVVLLGCAWLGFGLFSVGSYAHNYYRYRGYGPPHDAPGVKAGTLKNVHFHSAALGRGESYRVYLPPGYAAQAAAGHRFPVLYLLHGAPGWPELFLDAGRLGPALDELVAHHQIRPFIVVLPSGRDGTFRSDTEWANTPDGRYESFVLDVVHSADARFATLADRGDRALGGNSEGAYAALNVGLHHLDTFGIIESWSGYTVQSHSGVFKHASAAKLANNSPADYVSHLRGQLRRFPLHAFVYSGNKDSERGAVRTFAHHLAAAGAHVTFRIYPGRHWWKLWRAQTPHMLRYANRWFAASATGSSLHSTPSPVPQLRRTPPRPARRHAPSRGSA